MPFDASEIEILFIACLKQKSQEREMAYKLACEHWTKKEVSKKFAKYQKDGLIEQIAKMTRTKIRNGHIIKVIYANLTNAMITPKGTFSFYSGLGNFFLVKTNSTWQKLKKQFLKIHPKAKKYFDFIESEYSERRKKRRKIYPAQK